MFRRLQVLVFIIPEMSGKCIDVETQMVSLNFFLGFLKDTKI